MDLIHDALGYRRSVERPAGWRDLSTYLKQRNVPKELVGNEAWISGPAKKKQKKTSWTQQMRKAKVRPPVVEWSKATFSVDPQYTHARAQPIVASVNDADTVYALFNNHKNADFKPYVLRSTDRGATWTMIIDGLPAGTTIDLRFNTTNADIGVGPQGAAVFLAMD